jgi:cysteinyl-tRNA synthetase
MAHSAENFLTLSNLLKHYPPTEIRFYLLRTHYRTPLLFALDSADGNQATTVRGIEESREALGRLRRAVGPEPLSDGDLEHTTVDAFTSAMDADFNTSDALAAIFDLAREVNRRREAGSPDLDRGRRTIVHLLDVLGIDLTADTATDQQSIGPFVDLLLEVRQELRGLKQWQLADSIRDRLTKLGVTVEDKPGGTSDWRLDR